MSDVTQFLYQIQPTRLEMLTQGPTAEEAVILSEARAIHLKRGAFTRFFFCHSDEVGISTSEVPRFLRSLHDIIQRSRTN